MWHQHCMTIITWHQHWTAQLHDANIEWQDWATPTLENKMTTLTLDGRILWHQHWMTCHQHFMTVTRLIDTNTGWCHQHFMTMTSLIDTNTGWRVTSMDDKIMWHQNWMMSPTFDDRDIVNWHQHFMMMTRLIDTNTGWRHQHFMTMTRLIDTNTRWHHQHFMMVSRLLDANIGWHVTNTGWQDFVSADCGWQDTDCLFQPLQEHPANWPLKQAASRLWQYLPNRNRVAG